MEDLSPPEGEVLVIFCQFFKHFLSGGEGGSYQAFFLHHILDYIGSLLGTLSVQIHSATRLIKKLIDGIQEDFSALEDDRAKGLALSSCSEIYHLLRENLEELITDIAPKYKEEFLWDEDRILEG